LQPDLEDVFVQIMNREEGGETGEHAPAPRFPAFGSLNL
jgi:hypothetical protein